MVHRGVTTAPSPGAANIGRRLTLSKNFRTLQDLSSEGFGNDVPAVGEIYLNGDPHCSGTLVANGIVLTAGHCVMPPRSCQYYPASSLTFVPDETVLPDYGNLTYAPYGYFQVVNTVTTQSWCDGDAGGDWAFMELAPDANGYQAGQYTGTWTIYQNISPIGRTWLAGYPGEGVFATPDYYSGYAQYHSDTTWDGDYISAGYAGFSSKPIILYRSSMTGGSSGGAVINQLSDGSWGIGGVINIGFLHQCPDNSCRAGQPNYTGPNYWGDWEGSVYFDSDISAFYQAMLSYFGLA
jgi:V8-like Glu-specific endopeptidase